ncbi:MAG: GNAT family N-acetyltransferase [Pseudomarimonas sp.]
MQATVGMRTAVISDLPELLRLEAQFVGDRLSARQLLYHLQQSDQRLRVCSDGHGLFGYSLRLQRRGSTVARLYSLVVDATLRGSGIGKQLLCDAESYAQQRGARYLRLEVRADNAAALALYVRAGYRSIGQYQSYYDDGMDALRLQKLLGAERGEHCDG